MVSALRTEARRGRLVIERIAGKDFVTLEAIEEMRRQCRVQKEPLLGKLSHHRQLLHLMQQLNLPAILLRRILFSSDD